MKKVLVLIVVFSFLNCKKKSNDVTDNVDKNFVTVSTDVTFDNSTLTPGDTITLSNGFRVLISEFKFLLTDVNLDGIKQNNVFVDWTKGKLNWGKFYFNTNPSILSFKIGVDSTINHLDPSKFDLNDPLNIYNAGDMHWSWKPGYIFVKIEGQLDTIPSDSFNSDVLFTFHLGTDKCIRNHSIVLSKSSQLTDGNYLVKSTLKLDSLFNSKTNPIKWKDESITHSSDNQLHISEKLTNLFQKCW